MLKLAPAEELPSQADMLAALLAKRTELTEQFTHHQAMCRQTLIDIDKVDGAIRVVDEDFILEDVRPSPVAPRVNAYLGEIARICFGSLQDAGRPLSTERLARHVMAERRVSDKDKKITRTMIERVAGCLRFYRGKGLLISSKAADGQTVWAINETYMPEKKKPA